MPLENTPLPESSRRLAAQKSPRDVNIYAIITLGALGLIFSMMAVPMLFFIRPWESRPVDVTPIPFESQAWKRADPIEHYRTVRSQMVDDLLKRKLLDGLSRKEVEQLLGPPHTDLAGAGVDASRWHMAYYVGLERQHEWSLDDEFLAIRFDEQGRVFEYRTVVN